MHIYVENQRGERFLVSEGWSSSPTVFDNDFSADLLATFSPAILDQIFDRFLAHSALVSSFGHAELTQDLLHTQQFPGLPTHFSRDHIEVYTAVRQRRILVEEAPLGEPVLDERQTSLRSRIRMALQKIIAEERAEAARIDAVHQKRNELEKLGAQVSQVAKGLGQAGWDLVVWTKDIAEVALLVNPIRMQTQLASATYDYYAHDKSFEASSREYMGKVKKEIVDVLGFDPSTITVEQLEQAFEIAHLVYDDDGLRSDISRFAKDYVKAQHSLEISEFAGGGVFEIILTIVLAAFTGGVGGAAAMAKNARLMFRFKDVGDLILDFAKYQKQRKRLKKYKGVKSESASFSDFRSDEVQKRVSSTEHSKKTASSGSVRRGPPVSLDEAEKRLSEARIKIQAGGYKPKYKDTELLDIVSKGELNDRFYMRLVFGDPASIKNKTMGFPRPSGRAPYWATTFDMAEAADSDPELLAGLFGISDFSPDQKFSIAIIDMDKLPPQAERKNFIPTYENMAVFGDSELAQELSDMGVEMDDIMDVSISEDYGEFISEFGKTGGNIHRREDVAGFAEVYTSDPQKRDILVARHIVQSEFGANELFSGNGLTKVDPGSRYAEEIGQKYGVVETFTFERDPLSIGDLEKSGAVKIIPAKIIKGI
ncbi:hypothetical protein [Microbulbifer sp. MCCC 1A16149]|uniref:hypothetical protein n=1 Tax=Microbulbifer sp. MCCC 1A16149 TaxID=3411322 RepID=UPI003D0B6EB7